MSQKKSNLKAVFWEMNSDCICHKKISKDKHRKFGGRIKRKASNYKGTNKISFSCFVAQIVSNQEVKIL